MHLPWGIPFDVEADVTLEIGLGIAVGAAFIAVFLWMLKTVMSPLSVKETGNPVAVDRQALHDHVMYLSTASPARTIGYLRILNETADYIQAQFESHGLSQSFKSMKLKKARSAMSSCSLDQQISHAL